jgi:hypothetical protein
MGELLVKRMDEMAANIEFGFHLENLVGTDLGNEGIGRRQRIFQIAFLDNLSAKLACLCLSMHPSSPYRAIRWAGKLSVLSPGSEQFFDLADNISKAEC